MLRADWSVSVSSSTVCVSVVILLCCVLVYHKSVRCGPAQSPPRCRPTKCNSPPIRGPSPTSYYSMWHNNCLWILKGEWTAFRSAAASQLLAYGGYGRTTTDYDTSPYHCSNVTSASRGTLVAYGTGTAGHVTPNGSTALYNRQCDYNSTLYNADCIDQSTLGKSKRRMTSSVTSSPPAIHGTDTCYYKKQRLIGVGYSYDVTTTSSSPSAAAADVIGYAACSHAFDVVNHA